MVFSIRLEEFHRAHLDPVSGVGLIVCPRPEDDVWLDGDSVFMAAWDDAVARLAGFGWRPAREASGFLRYEGCTEDGALVVGAVAEQALVRQELGAVDSTLWARLCEAAGVWGAAAERNAQAPGA